MGAELESILVTGANGFVGRHLCSRLFASGRRVVAAVRRPDEFPLRASVPTECLELFKNPERWRAALESAEVVVHLAAWAHKVGRADVAALNYINVEGSRFVAQLAVAAGIRRFVFLSSIKVNGESTSGIPYRENDAPSPEDEYGASKLAAEIEVRDICNQNGVECVIIRPPLVYGPGVKANFYRLLRLIGLGVPLPFGSLFNKRSMIGVANLSSFIEVCLTHAKAAGRTWLVSDREDLSTSELVARLGALMEKPPKLFKFPPEGLKLLAICLGQRTEIARLTGSLQVDASPALEELYWRPCTTVDEGLAQTVAAFKSGRP